MGIRPDEGTRSLRSKVSRKFRDRNSPFRTDLVIDSDLGCPPFSPLEVCRQRLPFHSCRPRIDGMMIDIYTNQSRRNRENKRANPGPSLLLTERNINHTSQEPSARFNFLFPHCATRTLDLIGSRKILSSKPFWTEVQWLNYPISRVKCRYSKPVTRVHTSPLD